MVRSSSFDDPATVCLSLCCLRGHGTNFFSSCVICIWLIHILPLGHFFQSLWKVHGLLLRQWGSRRVSKTPLRMISRTGSLPLFLLLLADCKTTQILPFWIWLIRGRGLSLDGLEKIIKLDMELGRDMSCSWVQDQCP